MVSGNSMIEKLGKCLNFHCKVMKSKKRINGETTMVKYQNEKDSIGYSINILFLRHCIVNMTGNILQVCL